MTRLLGEVGYVPERPQVLTAWLELAPGVTSAPTPAELRAFLAEQLPAHAIPAAFVTVDALPLTTNGKLDTAALPPPERTHRSSSGVHLEAETELEATVIALWERVLRIEPIGADDDFFALGGDSLAALEMIVAVAEATATEIGDESAFLHTTPRALAAAVEAAREAVGTDEVRVAGPDRGDPPPARGWTEAEPPPLSDGELAILYEHRADPSSVRYNVGRRYVVDGPVDGARFAAAVRTVAAAHVPLTWSYGARRRPLDPVDAVTVEVATDVVDRDEAERRVADAHRAPFDLDGGPLLRALVQPVDDGTTVILLACHHVSGDAGSFDRLWAQIDGVLTGGPAPDPATDYATFTAWQRTTVTDADREHFLTHGRAPADRLTTLAPRRLDGGVDGFSTRIAATDPRRLRAAGGGTGFATALAAVAATISRHGLGPTGPGPRAVPLDVLTSARTHGAADDLVGYFLNPLPVVVDAALDRPLDAVRAEAAAAIGRNLAHRAYPYGRIVADRAADGAAEPPVRILVAYDELPTTTLDGHPVTQQVLSNGSAVTDVTVFVEVRDDRVDLSVEHRGTVVDRARAERLLADVDAVLTTVVDRPSTTVGQVALAGPASVLTGRPLEEPPRSLLPTIVGHGTTAPASEAVWFDSSAMSWADLAADSAALAWGLRARGVAPGDRVAVQLPRSGDLLVAIVGTLRSGAAYVPIDPTYPPERIALVTAAAGAVLTIGTALDGPATTVADLVEAGRSDADRHGGGPVDDPGPDTAAYVIFTSGSTGAPRGVPVTHRQLAASTVARRHTYDTPPGRFLVPSSPAFDSSIVGLFWTLWSGGTVVVPTDRDAHDVDRLVALVAEAAVTHTLMVPSLYQALLDRADGSAPWPDHVIVAGEACPPALVARHHARHPATRLTNEYGPTEATVWATAHHLGPRPGPVPIGGPIAGTWVAVVDGRDEPVPVGAEGHLVIGGAGVVDGYLDDPGGTTERFGHGERGRFFRTGDRAVVDDGTVWFLGRMDDQLNVGGVRAEPGDIERVVTAEPTVGAALVVAADPRPVDRILATAGADAVRRAMEQAAGSDDPGAELVAALRTEPGPHLRLVAHLEPVPGGSGVDLDAVATRVAEELPTTMRPARYQVHHRLPRTPNDKLDRAAVARLPIDGPTPAAPSRRPAPASSGPVDAVAEAFAAVLGTGAVGPDQSFFELGGHSISAVELLLALERRFGIEITVSTLYDHPTPASLAALLDPAASLGDQYRYLVPIQPAGSAPPIFGIHVLGINSEFYRPLAERLGPDQPLLGLGLPTAMPDTSGPTDVAEVAARYADELERHHPRGPVTLAAVSLGSVVAFELAHQLGARGRDVAAVLLFDAAGPGADRFRPRGRQRLGIHWRGAAALSRRLRG